MTKLQGLHLKGSERRRFERVDLPPSAGLHVTDRRGKRLGALCQLGRGGCSIEPERSLKRDKRLKFVLVCESELIRRPLEAIVRYTDGGRVGLEFVELDADSAVDIGILIGKFYASESAHA
jgi:hypothetical protein